MATSDSPSHPSNWQTETSLAIAIHFFQLRLAPLRYKPVMIEFNK